MSTPPILSVLVCLAAAGCASGPASSVPSSTDPMTGAGSDAQLSPQRPVGRTAEERRTVPWEVTLGGSGTNDEHFDRGNGHLDIAVGYYFTEVVELAVRQSASYSDDEGATWKYVRRLIQSTAQLFLRAGGGGLQTWSAADKTSFTTLRLGGSGQTVA